MKQLNDFEDYITIEAICTYLRSFGYNAVVHNNSMSVHVKQGEAMMVFNAFDAAKEFIKDRANCLKLVL